MENRRYHILIEKQVDAFIECCQKYLTTQNIKVWVIKDEVISMVGIGDPDKLFHNKDFGFTIPYETILTNHDNAFDEFVFKLNHFIKIASASDKFKAFKK